MKPSQVLFAHSVHVFTEAPSQKRAVLLSHTHVLTNLHPVPIAKLTHMPHGFGRSALHQMDQAAASLQSALLTALSCSGVGACLRLHLGMLLRC